MPHVGNESYASLWEPYAMLTLGTNPMPNFENESCTSLGNEMSCSLVQDGEQHQGVVRAVQLECRCMQHECSRQAEAIQLLEAAANQRRMQERQQEHDFWDVAREALGKSL